MIKVFALLALLAGLTGCGIHVGDIGKGAWETYEITLLDKQVRFEMPAEASVYGAPEAQTTELNQDGFIAVYLIGFGYNRKTGLGSQVRFAMQVRKILGHPVEETDIDVLKRAVEARSNYMTDPAGLESMERFDDFESFRLHGRDWVSLVNPTATSVYTRFNAEHFLSLDMMFASKFKPNQDERMTLEKLLLEIASKIKIRPASAS